MRRRLVVAALACVALSAACGLPTSGPVEPGLEVGAPVLPPVRFHFDAPPQGASPEQIVRGFLAASWSPDDDYRAARAYLTTEAAERWNPRATVTVLDATEPTRIEEVNEGRVQVSAPQSGGLDAQGRYSAAPAGTIRRSMLGLARVHGQWRISSLDPDFGLWLSRFYFERAYRPLRVYYVAARSRDLVADRRWFPVGAGLVTTLARAQLDAVPGYLSGAVVTGFPATTRLAVDAVAVTGGVAEIDLAANAIDASATQRRTAWAQMLATMRQMQGVQAVSLLAGGSPLDLQGVAGTPQSVDQLGFTAASATPEFVVVRRGSSLRVHDPDTLVGEAEPEPERSRPLPSVATSWSEVAIPSDLREVAAIDRQRSVLQRWRDDAAWRYPAFATHLTRPAYDRADWLWIGGQDPRGQWRMWVGQTGASTARAAGPPRLRSVATPWVGARAILAVRPAPDGARALVVVQDGDGQRSIVVAGIVRDAQGAPTALTRPWPVGGDIRRAERVAWVDDDTIALIGSLEPRGTSVPILLSVGGLTEPLAPVSGAHAIGTLGGSRGVVVVSSTGRGYGRVGGRWRDIGEMSDLVVPGR